MIISATNLNADAEIEISGQRERLLQFADEISEMTSSFEIKCTGMPSGCYSVGIRVLALEFEKNISDDRLCFELTERALTIKSTRVGFEALAASIRNVFEQDGAKYRHFHIDYFEGIPSNVKPMKHSIIFMEC